VRTRILAEASRIHDREGVEGVSMRAVAARVGVSATALYRHFRDKEALIGAIVESGFAILAGYLERKGKRNTTRFLAMLDHFLDFALQQPRLYELMFLRRRSHARQFPRDFARHKSATFDLLRDAVERDMAAGTMRKGDALEITLTVWAHAHGLISMFTLGRFGDDVETFRGIYRRSMRRLQTGLADTSRRTR
jgi:AcrR family transcriptional regulator